MYGYIYKTTNLINNKIYIGQHKSDTFNENYKGSGIMIKRALKEYGKEHFKVELLESCESQDELNNKEIYYINLFKSQDTNIGYNIVQGGQERFFTGQKHSEASKLKMSEKAKLRPHPPTTKGKISITNGKENHMINVDALQSWELKGFHKGKTIKYRKPWNKGLTCDSDERVLKYTQKRNKHFENGESIGCFGVKGNTYGFKKGDTPWNKGLKHYNDGHPNYYLGKSKNK